MTEPELEALELARGLARAGVPVFVAYPDPDKPGDFKPVKGWHTTTANPAYISAWKPGLALCAVMGQGLDLIDVDPRNGGDVKSLNGAMPEVIGMQSTPSGGYHYFVSSMGVGSRDGVLPGIDVKAGDPEGRGRGFAFIAPTVRKSKVTGDLAAYQWMMPPDMTRLTAEDESGRQLAELVRQARARPAAGLFHQPDDTGREHAGLVYVGDHHASLVSYAGWLLKLGFPIREAEACMRQRLGDLVQVLPDGSRPVTPRPQYTEAEALAELHDVYGRYEAGSPVEGSPDGRGRKLILTRAADIGIEPVIWAWEDDGQGRVPAGSLGLFAGREGTGKSSFLIWLTARITTGTLPGMLWGTPRGVIYVAVEDSWKYTIAPRLVAAGADLRIVYRAEVQVTEDETVSLSLPADLKLLEEAIRTEAIAVVVLDPLMSAISDTLDTHVNRQVRQALDPLARLADRTGAVIAGIAHFNKSSGTDASSLITASGAFKDVARFIFAFATDEDAASGGVITQTKNSLGLSNLPSLAYRMIDATVETPKGNARVGRLELDGQSERTVRDILAVQADGDRGEKNRAEDYLKKVLGGGPRRSKEIEEEAREIHDISQRTLKRARSDMRIPARKHGTDWWISLPEHEGDLNSPEGKTSLPAKSAKDAKSSGEGPVGTVGTLPEDLPIEPPDDGGAWRQEWLDRAGADGDKDTGWPAGSYGAEANQ